MNRVAMSTLAALFAVSMAHAQGSTAAQVGASANTQAGTNAQVQKSGGQSSASGSATASADGSAQTGQKSVALSSGSTVNAALVNSLDAKKNKAGDRVEARTTQDVKQDGQIVIPKGTRLVGHITQAQQRLKDQSQSVLGVAFDQAELRNGQRVPLNLAIQALAVSQHSAQASAAGDDVLTTGGEGASAVVGSTSTRGGGLIGGTVGGATNAVANIGGSASSAVSGPVGSTVNTAAHSTGDVNGLNASGMLSSNSQGVIGLQGLSLDSTASNATQDSMIVSSTRNIHLDGGTQMLLRAQGK